LQGESAVGEEYQARWTPAAVLIDRRGRIASPVTSGDDAIRTLVTHSIANTESTASLQNETPRPQIKLGGSLFKMGERAPRFALPNLQRTKIELNDLFGQEILLLFWNPGCGYCRAMADELKRWEVKSGNTTTRLVFISSGEIAAVQTESEQFHSLFLHDADFEIAPLFGAKGTPSAVLLDAEGRIASSLAVGEQNVLALLGIRKTLLPIAKVASKGAAALQPAAETVIA
jgi:peroxiredoxin